MIQQKYPIKLTWNTLWRTFFILIHVCAVYSTISLFLWYNEPFVMVLVMGATFGWMGVIVGWTIGRDEHDFHWRCTCDK